MRARKDKTTSGIFETMRAYCGNIVYLPQHLARITEAGRQMKIIIPYTQEELKKIISKKIKGYKLKDAYVKLSVFQAKPQSRVALELKKYRVPAQTKYKNGYRAMVSSFWKDHLHPLAGIKTTERLLYELSFQEAKAKGFDEAIMLNSRGLICEGTRTNVFFLKDNTLCTPCLKCGCLDGITRQVVLDLSKKHKIKTKEGNFTIHDLLEADEAFFTNSLIGIMPLTALGKIGVGRKQHKITRFFIKEYHGLLTGKSGRSHAHKKN